MYVMSKQIHYRDEYLSNSLRLFVGRVFQEIRNSGMNSFVFKFSCEGSSYEFENCNIFITRDFVAGDNHWILTNRGVKYPIFLYQRLCWNKSWKDFTYSLIVSLIRLNLDLANEYAEYNEEKLSEMEILIEVEGGLEWNH